MGAKTLLLMRHAKSSWKDEDLADEERPLSKRGKKAASFMGSYFREQGFVPDAILCSPARRARDTAERVLKGGKFDCPIDIARELYFEGPDAYLKRIAKTDRRVQLLLAIGHNPDSELLLTRIAGVDDTLPTAAAALIEFDTDSWRSLLDARTGRLRALLRPKDLQGNEDA